MSLDAATESEKNDHATDGGERDGGVLLHVDTAREAEDPDDEQDDPCQTNTDEE